MTRNTTCSECGGKMQRGFVVDTEGRWGGTQLDAAYWVEGKPERNVFDSVKVREKEKHYIAAYRCESCGYLKLYAGPDLTPNK